MGKRESVSLMMQCAGNNESMTSFVSVVGPAVSVLVACGERQFNDAVCREEQIDDLVRQRRRAGDERPFGGGRTARSSASALPSPGALRGGRAE